eukprot:NODE_524_length_1848_cov_56.248112_g516_i0.p1 GENE.NODE_524_length_1848_cov_56.248112_g516_i0~~NODE_524_length_1848_cov_56.248112_g516_i0.p1  ORF type:complete len:477 (+),score=69.71 NODE_524_length_1848_cov_56.248112_g516_i0:165-1433(+)
MDTAFTCMTPGVAQSWVIALEAIPAGVLAAAIVYRTWSTLLVFEHKRRAWKLSNKELRIKKTWRNRVPLIPCGALVLLLVGSNAFGFAVERCLPEDNTLHLPTGTPLFKTLMGGGAAVVFTLVNIVIPQLLRGGHLGRTHHWVVAILHVCTSVIVPTILIAYFDSGCGAAWQTYWSGCLPGGQAQKIEEDLVQTIEIPVTFWPFHIERDVGRVQLCQASPLDLAMCTRRIGYTTGGLMFEKTLLAVAVQLVEALVSVAVPHIPSEKWRARMTSDWNMGTMLGRLWCAVAVAPLFPAIRFAVVLLLLQILFTGLVRRGNAAPHLHVGPLGCAIWVASAYAAEAGVRTLVVASDGAHAASVVAAVGFALPALWTFACLHIRHRPTRLSNADLEESLLSMGDSLPGERLSRPADVLHTALEATTT